MQLPGEGPCLEVEQQVLRWPACSNCGGNCGTPRLPLSTPPCSLNPDTAALLGRLASLQRLALDGNQVDDVSIRHVAALPRLRYVCALENAGHRAGGRCLRLTALGLVLCCAAATNHARVGRLVSSSLSWMALWSLSAPPQGA